MRFIHQYDIIVNRLVLLSIALFVLLQGCTQETPFRQGPPEGWEGTTSQWWISGTDTTLFFRDLDTLESMEVKGAEAVYVAGYGAEGEVREQFKRAVKRSLIRMYRNEPAIVDSLFETYLAPKVEDVTFTSDPVSDVDKFKKQSYKVLRRHFREPLTSLKLGTDVPVIYPDSLRNMQITGEVKLQVYLNAEGEPQSVELLEGIHPILDQSAMDATTRMRWMPAFVEEDREWKPIPSWARFRINYTTSQN